MSISSVSVEFRKPVNKQKYRIGSDAAELLMMEINSVFNNFLGSVKKELDGVKTVNVDAIKKVYKENKMCEVSNSGPYKKSNISRMLKEHDLRSSPENKELLLAILNGTAKCVMGKMKDMLKLQKRKTLDVDTVEAFQKIN
jgi:isochorismate hydrolase